jgi:ribose transport system substrate-binding protein
MSKTPFSRPQRGVVGLRLAVLFGLLFTFLAVPRFTASAHVVHANGPYTIGVSNNLIGNGWRDEMVCSIKAQAKASGLVKPGGVYVRQNQLNTAQQIQQIRDLISKHVSVIIIDPNSTTALQGAIRQALAQGIKVVVVDQVIPMSAAGLYQVANDQVAYGRLGMQWLATQLHGKGNIVILNGIAGAPADNDRVTGQNQVLKNYPNIHVVKRVWTDWLATKGAQQFATILNSGVHIDGVWTSGIDYVVINAYHNAHLKYVPVVGADNNEFVRQLATMRGQGVVGAAVTNPPPVGGVGTAVALKVLQGQSAPAITLLHPAVWANTNAAGLAQLRSHHIANRPPSFGAAWNVPGLTTYTLPQLLACSE